MNGNQVVKLNFTGPKGEEWFLVVDFAARQASLVIVETATLNGNIKVTDVQPISTRGM